MQTALKNKPDTTPGRPTVMTPETIQKLEFAFMLGAPDRLACEYAGIGNQTLYDYQKENPEYSERKKALKSNIKLEALATVAEKVVTKRNLKAAQWLLERTERQAFGKDTTPEDKPAGTSKDKNILQLELNMILNTNPALMKEIIHQAPEGTLPEMIKAEIEQKGGTTPLITAEQPIIDIDHPQDPQSIYSKPTNNTNHEPTPNTGPDSAQEPEQERPQ